MFIAIPIAQSPEIPPPPPVVEERTQSGGSASGGSGPSLEFLKNWPPQMPPYVALEAIVGPRFGQTTTLFPAFPGAASPDLSKPRLGNLTGDGGSFGGHALVSLRIPILAPSLGVDFNFRGAAKDPLAFSSSPSTDGINPGGITEVLPTRTLGIHGQLLGFGLGYRSLAFANGLPGLPGERSANLITNNFGLGIPLGPVEAAGGGTWGFGWVTDSGTAVVLPADGEAHLGLSVWGLKLAVGVRGELLAFGGDLGSLLKAFNPTSLASGVSPDLSAGAAAQQVQALGRFSYTWGPYVQAGVAF